MKTKSSHLIEYGVDIKGRTYTRIQINHPDNSVTVITMDQWENDQEIAEALAAWCDQIGPKLFQETVHQLLNSGLVYGEHSGGECVRIDHFRPVEVTTCEAVEEFQFIYDNKQVKK